MKTETKTEFLKLIKLTADRDPAKTIGKVKVISSKKIYNRKKGKK